MRKVFFILVLAVLPLAVPISLGQPFSLAAQTGTTASDPYTFSSSAQADTAEEALRLARSAAIKAGFGTLKRDELFSRIFIAEFPEGIRVINQGTQPVGAKIRADITIRIGQQELALCQNLYTPQAQGILDEADKVLDRAQTRLNAALDAERSLAIGDAWVEASQARQIALEGLATLSVLASSTVLSESGKTVDVLKSQLSAVSQSAGQSLTRFEAQQKQVALDEQSAKVSTQLSTLRTQSDTIRGKVAEWWQVSPFYDLPYTELEAYKTRIGDAQKTTEKILNDLSDLKKLVPAEQDFLARLVQLQESDAQDLLRQIGDLNNQVQVEIADPRMNRQARAEASAAFFRSLGEAALAVLWHDNTRTVRLHWTLPFMIPDSGPVQAVPGANLNLGADYAFEGVWIATNLNAKTSSLLPDNRYNHRLSQDLMFGFHGPFLFALGLQWDWLQSAWIQNTVASLDATQVTGSFERGLSPQFMIGSIPDGAQHPELSLLLRTRLAGFSVPLNLGLHGSLDLELRADLGGFLGIRGELWTRALQVQAGTAGPGNQVQTAYTDYARFAGFSFGIDLMPPGPYEIGVRFKGDWAGQLDASAETTLQPLGLSWAFVLGYGL